MKKYKYVLAIPIAAFSIFVGSVFVQADVAPSVTTVIHDSSHNAITSASVGSMVHARAIVASSTDASASSTPMGTVDFNLYPNTTCAGTSTQQLGVALVAGVAESSATAVGAAGLSYMVHYNGQSGMYEPTNSSCQSLTAVSTSTSISTTLSSSTVLVGSSVYSSATLSGVTANAGGSVAFNAYTDNACTAGAMSGGSKVVTNGVVPNSNALVFNNSGSFYWQAVYSGDANNAAATSSCSLLTVNATSTPPVSGTGSISGTVYNDLNRSGSKDGSEPGLAGWTINLYQGAKWPGQGTTGPYKTTVSDANGNYSFTGLANGTYSIEEINQPSLNQYTADYKSVIVSGGAILTGYDFGNVSGNPYDHPNKEGKKDKISKKEKKENRGNHWGWWWGRGNNR